MNKRIIFFSMIILTISLVSSKFSYDRPIDGKFKPRSYKKNYAFIDVYTEYNKIDSLNNSKDLKYSIEKAETIEDLQTISLYKIDSIVINRNNEGNVVNSLIYLKQAKKIEVKQIFSPLYFKYKKNNEIRTVKFPIFYLDKIAFDL